MIDANDATALTIDTGKTVTNAGILEATNTGGLVIDDAVANSGTIAAHGGNVAIMGALSGTTGKVEIFSGDTVTFGSSATNGVTFEAGGNAHLILNAAQSFSGSVTTFAASDTIDAGNVNFNSPSFTHTYASNTLTVSDGTHTSHIKIVGTYVAADFTFGTDSHVGTLIGYL